MEQQPVKIKTLKDALDEIGAAGGAARLQLHLLAMEAQQRKDELGANLDNFEQKLDRGLHKAFASAADQARQLTKTVQDFLGRQPASGASGADRVGLFMSTPVQSCYPNDLLSRAAQIMWECDCGAVPVVGDDGRLCGMITDRDLCMGAYTKGQPLSAIRVVDVMSKHPHSCATNDALPRAIALMANAQVRRLPVIDADGRLVGMLALADIVRGASMLGQSDAETLVFRLLGAISKRPSSPPADGRPLAAE